MSATAIPQVAIIDDDESLCRSLGRLLRVAGYRCSIYHSAEQFMADSGRAAFACLLVDIQLGGMSGLEMQQYLVAEGSRVPVIFITAHDEPVMRAQAARGGCAGFFGKTESGARILDAIDQALAAGAGR